MQWRAQFLRLLRSTIVISSEGLRVDDRPFQAFGGGANPNAFSEVAEPIGRRADEFELPVEQPT
jgi:hypothetical protein